MQKMIKHASLGILTKAILAASSAALFVWPAAAQAPTLAMLDRLSSGQWEIRDRDTGEKRRLCIRTGRDFIQLRHWGQNCSRTVVEDGATEVTVQYTCRGKGYGRTNIRRESNVLVQIEGQGIAGSKHFEFSAEGRRVGSCPG